MEISSITYSVFYTELVDVILTVLHMTHLNLSNMEFDWKGLKGLEVGADEMDRQIDACMDG